MGVFVNLTTNIEVTKAVPRIVKWRVTAAQDCEDVLPPHMLIRVQAYGAGTGETNPYGTPHTLVVRDDNALSTCLRVKVTPQNEHDQAEVHDKVIGGAPYTDLAALYAANVSAPQTNRKRLQALQAGLVAAGVLSAEFAGT